MHPFSSSVAGLGWKRLDDPQGPGFAAQLTLEKPVEIGDLKLLAIWGWGGPREVQTSPPRP